MFKSKKVENVNLFYLDEEQNNRKLIDEKIAKKKNKEREKRIRQNNQKKAEEEEFDLETETVIKMTNRNRIKKAEEEKKKATKLAQKRNKRNKKIKRILKIVVIILILAGGITFAMVSPIFNIKEIKVINNAEVSTDTVKSLSGLTEGQNIFRFNKIEIENNIKTNPYIETLKITRKIPSTVEIEVIERVASYCISFMGKYAYINTQGYILEISEDTKGMPIIYGTETKEEEIELGKRLNNNDLIKLEDVIKIINTAKENNLAEKITSIDITNKNNYIIYMKEEQKNIHIGDNSNLNNKMLFVSAIIETEKGKAGDVYVNGDLNNKFEPYFREKL